MHFIMVLNLFSDPNLPKDFNTIFDPIEELVVPLDYAQNTSRLLNFVNYPAYSVAYKRVNAVHIQLKGFKEVKIYKVMKMCSKGSKMFLQVLEILENLEFLECSFNGVQSLKVVLDFHNLVKKFFESL